MILNLESARENDGTLIRLKQKFLQNLFPKANTPSKIKDISLKTYKIYIVSKCSLSRVTDRSYVS